MYLNKHEYIYILYSIHTEVVIVELLLDRMALTTYVDAVYCYRPRSLVCRSLCRSVTLVIPAKTAEPIEMPFGLRTRVGPRNHVLDCGPDPCGKGQ